MLILLFLCVFQVDDNIPLRVMLLLMDEVFDLKEKNQWLRRNIKNLLQQLIRATYGDTINRSETQTHAYTDIHQTTCTQNKEHLSFVSVGK